MKFIQIFGIGCLLFFASCGKDKKCSRSYELEHPVSVYPILDSYSIGDTIWFELNFSDNINAVYTNNFTGEHTSQAIRLKDVDFQRTVLSFTKIVDTTVNLNGQNTSGWESFTPIYQAGSNQSGGFNGIEFKYTYFNSTYTYKLGMICNESGRFIFNAGFQSNHSAAMSQLDEQDLTPDCEQEIITSILFPVNKQANGMYLTNYNIFEQFMNPGLETDLKRIKERCFTFVVN